MFDGMPEQFYQFLAAATTTSRATAPTNIVDTTSAAALSLPLSFSLHHVFPTTYTSPPPPTQPAFDAPYHHLFHHHHSQFVTRNGVKDDDATLNPPSAQLPTGLQDGGDAQRSSPLMLLPDIPWSNDETLALFRIRCSMDNTWFPDFIWENVSRKLAEIGFKRSAEKCKEKFEEETRSFGNSIVSSSNNCNNNKTTTHTPSNNNNNNYRLFGELEDLCINNNSNNIDHGGDDHGIISPPPDQSDHPQTSLCQDEDIEDDDEENLAEVDADVTEGERTGNDGEGEETTRNDNNVREDEQSVGDSEKTEENTKRAMRKRKRQKKFEMFKGFCEKIVGKMMAQQEQLHCKILQDMVKRDEEKIAMEEAWKKQEFERLEKVLEVRAHEQAASGDRQAKILDFLKEFSVSSNSCQSLEEALEKLKKVSKITSSNSFILSQDSTIIAQLRPSSSCSTKDHSHHNPKVTNVPSSSSNDDLALPVSSSSLDQASKNPNLTPSQNDSSNLSSLVSSHKFSRSYHTSTNATEHTTDIKARENQSGLKSNVGYGKDDTGRRWPRDEVLALINIRCSLFDNNGGDTHQDREGYNKGPLWERISQKMMELGYKRSAKRCKEKWENINKYFRKTKDLNKKRSIDSRTCPYYYQLSRLYSQGTLMGSTDRPTNLPGSPENRSLAITGRSQGNGSSTPSDNGATNTIHASQGNEASVVQVPRFDFEF